MDLPEALVLVHDRTVHGGAELALLAILEQCREWGIETYLVTGRKGGLHDRFEALTERQLEVPFPYRRKPGSWVRMPRFLREGRKFVSGLAGRRLIWAGDVYDTWCASKLGPTVSQFQGEFDFDSDASLRKWMNYGGRRARRLVASEPIVAVAAEHGLEVRALNPRVDRARFEGLPDRAALRRRLGFGEDELVCACIGRIYEAKGQLWLVEQYRRRPELNERWTLVICGSASPEDEARLRDDVVYLGWRDDIPEIMRAADLLILPGTFRESYSRTAAESVLAGTPLIALDTGALSRLHPVPELLVPPAQRERLLDLWSELDPRALREHYAGLPQDAYGSERWREQLRSVLAVD